MFWKANVLLQLLLLVYYLKCFCRCSLTLRLLITTKYQLPQTFRFMVGLSHCPMVSKYSPSLSKAVGPVDPSFLVVKKSHLNKNIHPTASIQIPQNRKYMSVVNTVKYVLKATTQKRQNKDLHNIW